MPVPTDITAGTISISGSTVTGVGTSFEASDIRQGDLFIWIEGGEGQWSPIVQTVTSNTVLTLAEPWTGPTISGARYRLRYQWDSSRVSAQSRQLIEMLDNGNVLALAGLTGPGVPVFDGPHSMTIRPEADFINGVAYDVQVDTLADRAAYDGQAAGFAVLVSDVGDGRTALYSKVSNASGDWTDPAYVTGPPGLAPVITAEVTVLPSSGTALVIVTPTGVGYNLDFQLPAADGFYWEGTYDAVNAYPKDSVVRRNGSSFIAVQDVPAGQQPSGATPPIDTAFWEVVAAKGNDGTGTVTAINSGQGVNIDSTDPTMPIVELVEFNTTSIGAVPAPTSGDVAANRLLAANGAWVDLPTNADLEFTVAQMMMRLADIDNVAQFLGPNGNRFADSYDALTYVDVAGATNLSTAIAGILKPTSTSDVYSVTNNPTITSFGGGWGGYGARTRIPASAITTSGNTIRITIAGPPSGASGPLVFNSVYVGHSSYNGGDFDGTQVPVTFGGLANGSVPIGGVLLSDPISYALDETKDLIISMGMSGTSSISFGSNTSYLSYEKSGGSGEAANSVISGYTATTNQALAIDLIEVRTSVGVVNNLTVRSTSFSAPSAPIKMKSLLNVREVEAATAGTDYFIDVSRDGGTTWSAMTLTERYSLPSGLRVVEGTEIDVSGQPSGTAPRYRLRTANNKNVEFHDTYLYWS